SLARSSWRSTTSSSTATCPPELSVTLTLRWLSASRVWAAGRSTGRSATDSMGAVTSRMITSTSATSMMGVTLTRVISSWRGAILRRMLPPDHGDSSRAVDLGFVEHAHECAVGDVVRALHHHVAGLAGRQQRLERGAQPRAGHGRAVHGEVLVVEDRDL